MTKDIFGRVVISAPDTVMQYAALKREFLASRPVQVAHDHIMAAMLVNATRR